MAAKGQRNPEPVMEVWEEADYILLTDKFTNMREEKFVKGDVLHLDEAEATRLGNGNAIAVPGSLDARRAQASAIEDEDLRATQNLLLDAEALEEKAKRLRERAAEGAE